jgi:hypothetical protein
MQRQNFMPWTSAAKRPGLGELWRLYKSIRSFTFAWLQLFCFSILLFSRTQDNVRLSWNIMDSMDCRLYCYFDSCYQRWSSFSRYVFSLLVMPFLCFSFLIINTLFCYNQLVIPLEETHTAYMVLLSLIRQATLLEITQQTSHPTHCHQAIMVLHTHRHQQTILEHRLRQCKNQTVAQSSTCHPRLIRTILKIWDYRNQTKLTSKYLIISNKDLIISCSKV